MRYWLALLIIFSVTKLSAQGIMVTGILKNYRPEDGMKIRYKENFLTSTEIALVPDNNGYFKVDLKINFPVLIDIYNNAVFLSDICRQWIGS